MSSNFSRPADIGKLIAPQGSSCETNFAVRKEHILTKPEEQAQIIMLSFTYQS